MRLGFGLLHTGPAATADAIAKVCKHAESLGYESLYVADRVLFPTNPKVPYPASSDGKLPEQLLSDLDRLLSTKRRSTDLIRFGAVPK